MWAITIFSFGYRSAISSSRIGRAWSSEPARANVVPWWISIGSSSRSSASQTAQELGAERVDVLVDRAELAADETEVALHPLQLVDAPGVGAGRRRRSRPAAPDRARRTRDVVVRDDEPGRRRVERQHDRAVDVGERVGVVLVQAAAERDLGPGRPRLGRELLADVRRVLADVGVDVDDHGGDDEEGVMKITGDRDATRERRCRATTTP